MKSAGGLFGAVGTKSTTTTTEKLREAETKPYTPGPPSSTVPSLPPTTDTTMIQGRKIKISQQKCTNVHYS